MKRKTKIALLGDLIDDCYVYGRQERVNPESDTTPLVTVDRIEHRQGGAGNVYWNLKSLGVDTDFFTVSANISKKSRVVVNNKILLRFDQDQRVDNSGFMYKISDTDFSQYQYTVLSDYNKGTLDDPQSIVNLISKRGGIVIVDPKVHLSRYNGAWAIKPNQSEFEKSVGEVTDANILSFARDNNHRLVVVTLGDQGVAYSWDNTVHRIPSSARYCLDVTGAGDSFLAGMVYGLAHDASVDQAVAMGNEAAGRCVEKMGTYNTVPTDLSKKTVFTNGCFDILHRGHIELLNQSRNLGQKLIVGINSDASVRALKGNERPINRQEDRKAVLEALGCVDEVIIFDEPTPYNLIKRLKPDIITKGGDYKPNEVVGNDLATVHIIPYVDGYSTTRTINGNVTKIRR